MIQSTIEPKAAPIPETLGDFINYVMEFCNRQCNKWRFDSDPDFNDNGEGNAYVRFIDSGHLYFIEFFDGMWHAHSGGALDGRMTDLLNGAKRDDAGNLHLPKA